MLRTARWYLLCFRFCTVVLEAIVPSSSRRLSPTAELLAAAVAPTMTTILEAEVNLSECSSPGDRSVSAVLLSPSTSTPAPDGSTGRAA